MDSLNHIPLFEKKLLSSQQLHRARRGPLGPDMCMARAPSSDRYWERCWHHPEDLGDSILEFQHNNLCEGLYSGFTVKTPD